MATKTITIMNDAYEILLSNKKAGESFSEVIRRSFKKKNDLMKYAGCLKITDKEAEEMKKEIYNSRTEAEREKRLREL